MRILIITNLYPPHFLGGYELLCAQVVRGLSARGHVVEVLTSVHGGAGPDQVDGVQIRRVLTVLPDFARPPQHAYGDRLRVTRANRAATVNAIAAAAPDLIFLWSQLRITAGPAHAAQTSGRCLVYTFNDENFAGYVARQWRPRLRTLVRCLLDRTVGRGTTLFGLALATTTCISRCTRDHLVAAGVPIAGSAVIYQGIPIERFPCKSDPGALRTPLHVLYVGQLHDFKGVHHLIEAAALLAARHGPGWCTLSIVGDGPAGYLQRLRSLVPAGMVVDFPGRITGEALAAVYRAHDVFIFPSVVAEGFGLTFLEAMASGLPVISTTSGGQGECLVDGENCLTFPVGDAAALAGQLQRLAGDGALAMRLAAAGRRMVEERFTLDRYIDEIDALLRRAQDAGRLRKRT